MTTTTEVRLIKRCPHCGQDKPIGEFGAKRKLEGYCCPCRTVLQRERRQREPTRSHKPKDMGRTDMGDYELPMGSPITLEEYLRANPPREPEPPRIARRANY